MITDKHKHLEKLKLYNKGLSDRKIAKKLKLTVPAIFHWRKKLKLKPNREPRKTFRINYTKVKKLYLQNISDTKIAQRMGISQTTVTNRRNNNNYPPNKTIHKIKMPYIFEEQAKQYYDIGIPFNKIAQLLDVTNLVLVRWRISKKLPSKRKNAFPSNYKGVNPEKTVKLLKRYGLNNTDISMIMNE